MASGSNSQVVDLEDDVEESITDEIIKEGVSSLKSAFMSQHFAEVERLLVSMKEKMVLENKSLKKDKELMEGKARNERLERLIAETELKECKRECLQLKKELEGFNELLKSGGEDKRIIRELREEICELKCAKLKAETEVDAYKSKFEELGMRVFLLEKDLKLLTSEEPVNNVGVSKGVVEEKVLDENVVTVKTEVLCSNSNYNIVVKANGGPRSHSPESRKGDVGVPGSVSGECLGETAVKENGNGSERVVDVKVETVAADNHENMVLVANGGSRSNLPENGVGHVVGTEISDIDDDSSSNATLSTKKLAKQGCQLEADLGLEDVSNKTKLLKRKRTSCSNSEDDIGGSNEPRETKYQMLIQGPESVPVNHCAAATMFSGSTDRRNVFNPSRQTPTILRQCEEKTRVGQNSQIQWIEHVLDGFVGSDGEESSSSSESDDFDLLSDISATIKPAQVNRNHKKWKSEADLIAALEQEVELCLRAVCALFGQQDAVEKSSNFSSTFQNQVFDKVDAAREERKWVCGLKFELNVEIKAYIGDALLVRSEDEAVWWGTALAQLLIDGDPRGKLKKSGFELVLDDAKGFFDCRRLAIKYSKQLFEMYQLKGDPLF
ncbi:unnamed protein product [Dovyalis caffra]|uniref:Uncharacterized protein n=1 Tax=Dovyalis caffra TaxID=77055 RepID=A0AAV1S9X0_9ROSI|nr:unnamed protein product [Dovyalis caffra]